MKVSRILFGLGVGAVAGFAVALRHRDNQSVKNHTIDASQPTGAQSELQREIENMKQSFNESIEFGSSIGEEFKGLIGNFKSDINPNIEKLQSHIENLQNRGEDISNNLSKDK